MPIIVSYFNPIIAVSIQKVPLISSHHEDKFIWREEKNGKFSIRSAYQLIHRYQQMNQRENSTCQALVPFWKALYKIRVPHKIKVFVWRTCLNGLPSFSNLKRRQVAMEGKCALCDAREEDLAHAVFTVQML